MAGEKILVVEDESIIALNLKNMLIGLGYNSAGIVSSGESAIKKATETKPDLVLMDIFLNGKMDGVEAAENIYKNLDIPVVYLTAYADEKTLQRAKATVPYGYLLKPFEENELYITIEIALYKHKMELKLKESEEKYRTLAEASTDGIFLKSFEGDILDCNIMACKMLGYTKEELTKFNMSDIIAPESAKKYPVLISDNKGLGNTFVESLVKKKNGLVFPVEVNTQIVNINGKQMAISYFRDITERKWMEERLKETMARHAAIVEAFDGLIYICSQNNDIEFMNQRLTERIGYNATGEKCYRVIFNQETICPWCRANQLSKDVSINGEFKDPRDGRDYRVISKRIDNPDGTMSTLVMLHEITGL
ncbi:hypothetical protein CUJ83_11365 [Methanocella sp. CWC-04]|uniref:PAS domain S-box-containing protein n=1 Tax=Methanooceanicella nereidis TaxID=2052831 RepID=A0AAP2REB1_9EURY|nr:PAS domain S-box protein [Methanocella sp. CWC-04]MCD1295597.1 hypothetical protein [Methanocella sp. CWC-04]